jgi:predicted RNase H-like HicB family nuclease
MSAKPGICSNLGGAVEFIPVIYHSESGAWWAESPRIPEWTATAETLDELRALVEDGVRFALERDDVVVEHMLTYGIETAAAIIFDFAAGETVVAERPQGVLEPSRPSVVAS